LYNLLLAKSSLTKVLTNFLGLLLLIK